MKDDVFITLTVCVNCFPSPFFIVLLFSYIDPFDNHIVIIMCFSSFFFLRAIIQAPIHYAFFYSADTAKAYKHLPHFKGYFEPEGKEIHFRNGWKIHFS